MAQRCSWPEPACWSVRPPMAAASRCCDATVTPDVSDAGCSGHDHPGHEPGRPLPRGGDTLEWFISGDDPADDPTAPPTSTDGRLDRRDADPRYAGTYDFEAACVDPLARTGQVTGQLPEYTATFAVESSASWIRSRPSSTSPRVRPGTTSSSAPSPASVTAAPPCSCRPGPSPPSPRTWWTKASSSTTWWTPSSAAWSRSPLTPPRAPTRWWRGASTPASWPPTRWSSATRSSRRAAVAGAGSRRIRELHRLSRPRTLRWPPSGGHLPVLALSGCEC